MSGHPTAADDGADVGTGTAVDVGTGTAVDAGFVAGFVTNGPGVAEIDGEADRVTDDWLGDGGGVVAHDARSRTDRMIAALDRNMRKGFGDPAACVACMCRDIWAAR